MSLLDFLVLLLVAGICGGLAQAIAGYSPGWVPGLDCLGIHGRTAWACGWRGSWACRNSSRCRSASTASPWSGRSSAHAVFVAVLGFLSGRGGRPAAVKQRAINTTAQSAKVAKEGGWKKRTATGRMYSASRVSLPAQLRQFLTEPIFARTSQILRYLPPTPYFLPFSFFPLSPPLVHPPAGREPVGSAVQLDSGRLVAEILEYPTAVAE